MGAIVVQDEMDLQVGRHFALNRIEKAEELLVARAALAAANDFAGRDIEGGKKRGRPMPIIIVRSALWLARLHRQDRLGAIQGLDLLIHAKHDGAGLFWRVEVKPHNFAHLLHKERFDRELEVFLPMGLQPESMPDAFDGLPGKAPPR